MVRGEKRQEQEKKEGGFHRVERSYGSFQRALNLPDDANQDSIKASFKNGVLTVTIDKREVSAPKQDARSRSTADVAGSFVTRKTRHETRSRGSRCLVASTFVNLVNLLRSISMARKQCRVCGQPATVRVGSQSQRSSQHHAVVRRPLPAISAPAKAHRFAAGSLVRLAQRPVRGTSSAVTSSASATTRRQLPPIPMTWSMPRLAGPAAAGSGAPRPSRQWAGQPHQRTVGKPCCRRPPNTLPNLAAPRWIPNICCWRWPTATWSRPSSGQFKIKVDDLKRQIESEAKRGDKPFEGEIGVSPRVEGCAQPRLRGLQ